MPVEIKELVITAIMPSAGPHGKGVDAEATAFSGGGDLLQHEIVQACVQQVMKILERKEKR